MLAVINPAFSMVINESLVARTFASYTAQLFELGGRAWVIPALAAGLLVFAFLVNVSGNRIVGRLALVTAIFKVLGIIAFALIGLWVAERISFAPAVSAVETTWSGFWAGVAVAVLAYKGFTTITNSGSEIVDPHRNVGRAIVASIAVCVAIYSLVALAVAANLTLPEIIAAKDYSLAEAARPALGGYGLIFTVVIAIVATASGLIASVFAVSRMAAMLTSMKLIPHSHFGMPGTVQKHLVVYTVVLATTLAVFFDLSRIASLGAIFYLTMDIAVHWGVFRYLRGEVDALPWVLLGAITLDIVALGALVVMKAESDPMILLIAGVAIILIFAGESFFLRRRPHVAANHVRKPH